MTWLAGIALVILMASSTVSFSEGKTKEGILFLALSITALAQFLEGLQ